MRTHMLTFYANVELTEKELKMKSIWDNCIELGIPVPEEIVKFFYLTNGSQKNNITALVKHPQENQFLIELNDLPRNTFSILIVNDK